MILASAEDQGTYSVYVEWVGGNIQIQTGYKNSNQSSLLLLSTYHDAHARSAWPCFAQRIEVRSPAPNFPRNTTCRKHREHQLLTCLCLPTRIIRGLHRHGLSKTFHLPERPQHRVTLHDSGFPQPSRPHVEAQRLCRVVGTGAVKGRSPTGCS